MCVCVYECVCEGQEQGLSCSQAVMVPEVRRKRRRMERKSAPTCCELWDSFLCATANHLCIAGFVYVTGNKDER